MSAARELFCWHAVGQAFPFCLSIVFGAGAVEICSQASRSQANSSSSRRVTQHRAFLWVRRGPNAQMRATGCN